MDGVAFRFAVARQREARVAEETDEAERKRDESRRFVQQVLARAIVDQSELLRVQIHKAEEHAVTNAASVAAPSIKNKKRLIDI